MKNYVSTGLIALSHKSLHRSGLGRYFFEIRRCLVLPAFLACVLAFSVAPVGAAVTGLTVSAESGSIGPGGSATYLVSVEGTGGAVIDFSVTNVLPAGMTASFDPNPVDPPTGNPWTTNSTLTITTTAALPPGTYTFSVKATPRGGGSSVTGGGVLFVGLPTTTSLSSSANPQTYGEPLSFTVTVAGSGGTPTGTATLQDGSTILGSATLDGTGQAVIPVSKLGVATSPHPITAVYSGDTAFQSSTSAPLAQIIVPRALLVSAAGVDKVYDGTSGATVTLSDDRLAGDLITLSYSSAVFGDPNVGVAKPVAVSGIAIGGADAGNYAANSIAATTASITPRILTVTAVTDTKVYDGTTSSAGVPVLGGAGLAGGDTAAFTQSFDTKDVGAAKTLTPAGLVTDGNGGLNYSVTLVDATGEITPAALTITADDIIKSTGLPNPALTASYTGFVNGEDSNVLTTPVTLTTTAQTSSPPGDYPITASGASALNYTITYVNGVMYVLLPPLLTDTAEQGGQFTFRWETVAGQRYQLLSTADLNGTVWTPVGTLLTGTGVPISVTNAVGAPPLFFRVQVLPHAN